MSPDPVLIEPEAGDIFAEHHPHTVYKRERWFEEWVAVPYLYANYVHNGTLANPSRAELVWVFGEGIQPDKTTYEQYDRQALLNHYIKVEISQGEDDEGNPNDPLLWYGYVTEQSTDRGGAFNRDAGRVLTGGQAFLVYGLEIQLQQTIVNTSWVYDPVLGGERQVRRGLTFNDENPFQYASGNMTVPVGPRGKHLFIDDLSAATTWSSWNILKYLLEYHNPCAMDDSIYVQWKRSGDSVFTVSSQDEPLIQTHGRSLFSIIAQLFDMRRLLGCQVKVNADEEVELDVFSFNKEPITLPSGAVQGENQNPVELDFDRAVDVQAATLRDSSSHKVEQVRVVGANKRAIFTVAPLDGTLEADWTPADQAAYIAGPAGVAGLNHHLRERRINIFRSADRFERVFSWFRLPGDWDGYVGNGVGGAKNKAFPDDADFGAEEYYLSGLRFLRSLTPEFYSQAPATSPDESLRMVVLQLTDYPDGYRYQNIEQIGMAAAVDEQAGSEGGTPWSCSVAVQRHAPGIIVRVSGQWQYLIASADFVVDSDRGDREPEVNWRDNLLVTTMMELDSSVEKFYPPLDEILGQPHDVAKILTVHVGGKGRLDYVAPGTVQRQVDGLLVYHPDAGDYIRDDRDWMEDVARLCFEWYGQPRQAFDFAFRQICDVLQVGQLITKIGADETEEEVNSVVTGVTWDLAQGGTRVTTAFAEIDPVQLFAETFSLPTR